MKQVFILMICAAFSLQVIAQNDSTSIQVMKKNVVTVTENENQTHVKVGNEKGVEVITDEDGDTTRIRIGRRTFNVVEDESGTHVNMHKEEKNSRWTGEFNAHWAGMEMGINMFRETDYSLYNQINTVVPHDFMDLNPGKSITVNLNFAEWAFKNERNNFALVTGLGFSFMDFALDQPLTIEKAGGDGIIMPVTLNPDGLKKTKLNVSYLTAPLMLELKTPLRMGSSRLYIAGGVIGGLNIGSHTKYKYDKEKEKNKGNYHLSPFKYDITGRIGFGDFCVFVNYGMTSLFKEGYGPDLVPVTFGISFPNI